MTGGKGQVQRKGIVQPKTVSPKIKTISELNPRGKDQYCRGCYKKDAECLDCFWNTEKWVCFEAYQARDEQIGKLWKEYCKMPVPRSFRTKDDFELALFKWCVDIERVFHAEEFPEVAKKETKC